MNNDELEKKNDEVLDSKSEIIENDEGSNDDDSFVYRVDNNLNDNNYDNNKSFLYIAIGVIILILIIVLLILFANSRSNKKTGYSNVESKMVSAAKKYYNDNTNMLPANDDSVSISIESLVENNYLKPISEMISEGVSCSGYVSVFRHSDDYVYFPYLNCGSEYESKRLTNKIIEDSIVSSGDGLYKNGNEYIFKGEYPNNFVKFDDKEWRIVKINSDGSLKLLYTEKKVEKRVWDDRYNSSKESYVGINDFSVSRILDYLKDSYENETYVSKKNMDLLVKHSWCIGKFSSENIPINSMDVCSETYDDLYIGLLSADEVLVPSLSTGCINLYDAECTNYNYFFSINTGWTLNSSSDKSYIVFSSNGGSVSSKNASLTSNVRPVVNVNSNVLYSSGNGTESDPYIIGD